MDGRRALALALRQGLSQARAAEAVGVQRHTVNAWLERRRAQGEGGVLDGREVAPHRGKGLLTAEEASHVRRWIADKTPDQLKLPFALWTSRAVRDMILLRLGRTPGLSTVQLHRKRWGMTPQKPRARDKERSAAAIAAWLAATYPAIARRARAQRAAIYWGDETGITNQDQIGRTYAPKGQTPVVARTARRPTQSMISAVSNRALRCPGPCWGISSLASREKASGSPENRGSEYFHTIARGSGAPRLQHAPSAGRGGAQRGGRACRGDPGGIPYVPSSSRRDSSSMRSMSSSDRPRWWPISWTRTVRTTSLSGTSTSHHSSRIARR